MGKDIKALIQVIPIILAACGVKTQDKNDELMLLIEVARLTKMVYSRPWDNNTISEFQCRLREMVRLCDALGQGFHNHTKGHMATSHTADLARDRGPPVHSNTESSERAHFEERCFFYLSNMKHHSRDYLIAFTLRDINAFMRCGGYWPNLECPGQYRSVGAAAVDANFGRKCSDAMNEALNADEANQRRVKKRGSGRQSVYEKSTGDTSHKRSKQSRPAIAAIETITSSCQQAGVDNLRSVRSVLEEELRLQVRRLRRAAEVEDADISTNG